MRPSGVRMVAMCPEGTPTGLHLVAGESKIRKRKITEVRRMSGMNSVYIVVVTNDTGLKKWVESSGHKARRGMLIHIQTTYIPVAALK